MVPFLKAPEDGRALVARAACTELAARRSAAAAPGSWRLDVGPLSLCSSWSGWSGDPPAPAASRERLGAACPRHEAADRHQRRRGKLFLVAVTSGRTANVGMLAAASDIQTGDQIFVHPAFEPSSALDNAILATGEATVSWWRTRGVNASNETASHVALAWRNESGSLFFVEAVPPTVTVTPS